MTVAKAETKHTPGPWRIEYERRSGICSVVWDFEYRGQKFPYAIAGSVGFGRFPEGQFDVGIAQRDANARLIAAAPELLAAVELRRMLDRFVETDTIDAALKGNIERRCRELGWKGEESCFFSDFVRDLADSAIAKAGGCRVNNTNPSSVLHCFICGTATTLPMPHILGQMVLCPACEKIKPVEPPATPPLSDIDHPLDVPPATTAAKAGALPGASTADAAKEAGGSFNSSCTDALGAKDGPTRFSVSDCYDAAGRKTHFSIDDVTLNDGEDQPTEVATFQDRELAVFACQAMNAHADADGLYKAPPRIGVLLGLMSEAMEADLAWDNAQREATRLYRAMQAKTDGRERLEARIAYEDANERSQGLCGAAMKAARELFEEYRRQVHPTRRADGETPKLGDAQSVLAGALGVPAAKLGLVADAHAQHEPQDTERFDEGTGPMIAEDIVDPRDPAFVRDRATPPSASTDRAA